MGTNSIKLTRLNNNGGDEIAQNKIKQRKKQKSISRIATDKYTLKTQQGILKLE